MFPNSGPQGAEWMKGFVTIPAGPNYQLKFEAVRGATYLSEIALDDITIRKGQCLPMGK